MEKKEIRKFDKVEYKFLVFSFLNVGSNNIVITERYNWQRMQLRRMFSKECSVLFFFFFNVVAKNGKERTIRKIGRCNLTTNFGHI